MYRLKFESIYIYIELLVAKGIIISSKGRDYIVAPGHTTS